MGMKKGNEFSGKSGKQTARERGNWKNAVLQRTGWNLPISEK
jgi:hypothetical protein